jgi:DNA-binding NarL/FixJ family response regulator
MNDVVALNRAADGLGVSIDDLGPAVDDGLLTVGDVVAFRHPLIRTAAYESAPPEKRRRAHEAYAAVLDADADDLRRVWHRAGAMGEPDEEVAAQLTEAAARSVERGAHAAAVSAFERAAELSPADADRGHRLRLAAQAALDGGRSGEALVLVERARPFASDPADAVGLEYVRAAVEIQSGTPEEAHAILMQAAEDIAPHDPALATAMVLEAIEVAVLGGWTERAFVLGRDLVSRFEPSGTDGERFMRAFIEGVAALAKVDPATAHERLTEAITLSQALSGHHSLLWAGGVHMYLGDPTRARGLYRRSVDAARATGSFSAIPWALLLCANADMAERKVTAVEASVTEGLEIARQTSQHNIATVFLAFSARVAAHQGRVEDCRRLAEEALAAALTNNVGAAMSIARTALAELGDGDAARAQLDYVASDVQVSMLVIALPELTDACARAGCPEAAAPALDVYELYARQAQGTAAQGILARCRALVAEDPADKQRFFQEAMGLHARGVPPFERARTQTNYGEFLRRARRRVEAREQLRAALETFEGMGAVLWARRAREELEATGETTRKRDDSTRDELTPQELRIAQRVAAGSSNREVAAQLFISPKTVEYHLSKVFMKLGISSRVELARMELGEPEALVTQD